MKKTMLIVLGCILLVLAAHRFLSGIEIWRAYVSLFLGVGNIVIAFKQP